MTRLAGILWWRIAPVAGLAAVVPALRRLDLALAVAVLVGWTLAEAVAEDGAANRAAAGNAADAGTRRLVLGAHLLAWWLPAFELALVRRPPHTAAAVLGLALALGGAALRVLAVRALGRFFTGTVTVTADQTICTSGPYSRMRHPAYVGLAMINVGVALACSAWTALAIIAVATVAAIQRRVFVEESLLMQTLGAEYAAYTRTTPRWPWQRIRA